MPDQMLVLAWEVLVDEEVFHFDVVPAECRERRIAKSWRIK